MQNLKVVQQDLGEEIFLQLAHKNIINYLDKESCKKKAEAMREEARKRHKEMMNRARNPIIPTNVQGLKLNLRSIKNS